MVTGDQHAIAVETSRRLGLGTNIMEGAELLQERGSAELGDKVGRGQQRLEGMVGGAMSCRVWRVIRQVAPVGTLPPLIEQPSCCCSPCRLLL